MAQRSPTILDRASPASPFHYPASQTALMLMDYQNLTLQMMPAEQRPAIMHNAQGLRDWARNDGVLVLHCLIDTSRAPEAQRKITAERWPALEAALKAHPGIEQEADELKVAGSTAGAVDLASAPEITLSRRAGSFTAMHSDGIRDILARRGIRSLVLAGVSTSGCVLGTARQAADDGFVVTVIEDACGDPVKGMHETLCSHAIVSSSNVLNMAMWTQEWKVV